MTNPQTDLLAALRLLGRWGLADLTHTHCSARAAMKTSAAMRSFHINPQTSLFNEIRQSDLAQVTMSGDILYGVPNPGWSMHAAIYERHADINCIIHTHSENAIALGAMDVPLLPISQNALLFYGPERFGFHDYDWLYSDNELERVLASLGGRRALIMRGHGTLVVGRSVGEAMEVCHNLESAIRVQLEFMKLANHMGERRWDARPVLPPEVCEKVAKQWDGNGRLLGQKSWPALRASALGETVVRYV